MGIIESTRRPKQAASGRWIVMPRNVNAHGRLRNRVVRRRRQNFVRLLALAAASLVLAALPHLHWLVWVHLLADVALGLYVWRLLVYKQRERHAAEGGAGPHDESVMLEEPEPHGLPDEARAALDAETGSPTRALAK